PADAWFSSYVHAAADAGIVSGYADANGRSTGNFGPSDLVTLGQTLKIAVEGAGFDTSRYSTIYVSEHPTWLTPYYQVALNEGFGTFVGADEDVNAFASRMVVARAIADAFGLMDDYAEESPLDNPYADVHDQGTWTYPILRLTADGVVSGD